MPHALHALMPELPYSPQRAIPASSSETLVMKGPASIDLKHFTGIFSLYPILTSLLKFLSGSDASSFLALLDIEVSEAVRQAYCSIYRDIPECIDWIRSLTRKGHTVVIAGKDLISLKERLENPQRYYDEQCHRPPLRLWLAAVANGKYTQFGGVTNNWVLLGDECKSLDNCEATEQIQMMRYGIMGSLFPAPGVWQPGEFKLPGIWQKSLVSNEANLELVCSYGCPNRRHNPNVITCPRVHKGRDFHFMCTDPTQHPELSPGWLQKYDTPGSLLDYTIPYTILRPDAIGWKVELHWAKPYPANYGVEDDADILIMLEASCPLLHDSLRFAIRTPAANKDNKRE